VRDFMLVAHELEMTDGQYEYIVAAQVPPQSVNTPWVAGDHDDETARLAFQSVLQVRPPVLDPSATSPAAFLPRCRLNNIYLHSIAPRNDMKHALGYTFKCGV